jgi:hypothetical protein
MRGDNHRAPELTERHDCVVVAIAVCRRRTAERFLEPVELRHQFRPGVGVRRCDIHQHRHVLLPQRLDHLDPVPSLGAGPDHLLERVRGLTHRTHHDEQVVVWKVSQDACHVAHAGDVRHAGAAELEDLHQCSPAQHSSGELNPRRIRRSAACQTYTRTFRLSRPGGVQMGHA